MELSQNIKLYLKDKINNYTESNTVELLKEKIIE